MRYLTWYVLAGVVIAYACVVSFVEFAGPVALVIHFVRITATVAAAIIYIQVLPTMFQEVPPPRRDYLFAAINFFLISLVCFSFWNEAGRIFKVDTSVFTSYIAGGFSIFAIIAAVFAMIAPDTGGNQPKILAVVIGAIMSAGLVFVAPLFR